MNIEKIIDILTAGQKEEKVDGFLRFLSDKLWDKYNEFLMDKIVVLQGDISKWTPNLPNASENKPYSCEISLPEVVSLPDVAIEIVEISGITEEQHGLNVSLSEDKAKILIEGTPCLNYYRKDGKTAESAYELVLRYKFNGVEMPTDRPVLERRIPFVINQDPRYLWRNLPVEWDKMEEPRYQNDDVQCDYIKVESIDGDPQKDIVAASKRGRSHAQEAKPRDDFYRMKHMDNGWYIMAVGDGAGSAQYSREGSRIACTTVVDYCQTQLLASEDFDEHILTYNEYKDEAESDARKMVGDYIYKIVGTAAFKAHKAINEEAAQRNIPSKKYATTLLLAICKKFTFGWFVASFWVGDGAICLYDKNAHTAKLLGIPDEGEFAGQTRFITMPEIFKDATELYQRLRFNIVPDFTALFLMTDGVSDPKFETDANLINPDKWDDLWEDLTKNEEHPVDLSDDHEDARHELLDWLDFWSPGNHDDRTIAILY